MQLFESSKADLRVQLERYALVGGDTLRGRLYVTVRSEMNFTALRLCISGREVVETNLDRSDRGTLLPQDPSPQQQQQRDGSGGENDSFGQPWQPPSRTWMGALRQALGGGVRREETLLLEKWVTLLGRPRDGGGGGAVATLAPGVYHYPFELRLPPALCPTYTCRAGAADIYADPARAHRNRRAYVSASAAYTVAATLEVARGFNGSAAAGFTVLSALQAGAALARPSPSHHGYLRQTIFESMRWWERLQDRLASCVRCFSCFGCCCCLGRSGPPAEIICDLSLDRTFLILPVDPQAASLAVASAGAPAAGVAAVAGTLDGAAQLQGALTAPSPITASSLPQTQRKGGGDDGGGAATAADVEKPFSMQSQTSALSDLQLQQQQQQRQRQYDHASLPGMNVARGIPYAVGDASFSENGDDTMASRYEPAYPGALPADAALAMLARASAGAGPFVGNNSNSNSNNNSSNAPQQLEERRRRAVSAAAGGPTLSLTVANCARHTTLTRVRAELRQLQALRLPEQPDRRVTRVVVLCAAEAPLRLPPGRRGAVALPLAPPADALARSTFPDLHPTGPRGSASGCEALPTLTSPHTRTTYQLHITFPGLPDACALPPLIERAVPLTLAADADPRDTVSQQHTQCFRYRETEIGDDASGRITL